jgi:hypothetical protein
MRRHFVVSQRLFVIIAGVLAQVTTVGVSDLVMLFSPSIARCPGATDSSNATAEPAKCHTHANAQLAVATLLSSGKGMGASP